MNSLVDVEDKFQTVGCSLHDNKKYGFAGTTKPDHIAKEY